MAAVDIMGQVFMVIWIILGMVALVAGWMFFALFSKFKYKVRVRELVNDRKIVFDDRARLIEKDGQKYWKLMKLKDKLPIPPAEVIDIDNKGKRVVEVYRNAQGEHFWIKDDAIVKEFQPITTEERDFLINNFQRAEKRRGKKWTDQLPVLAGLGALVIIVVCLMIFWGDMAKPILEMGDKLNHNQEIQLEIVERLEALDKNVQVLKSEKEYSSSNGDSVRPPR